MTGWAIRSTLCDMAESVGNRVVADLEVACPAGDPIGEVLGGSGVYCRIERSLVISSQQPKSLGRFCCSVDGHRRCPTLRRETHRREAGEIVDIVDQIDPEVLERQRQEEAAAEAMEELIFRGKKLELPESGKLHLTCEVCGKLEWIRVPSLARVSDPEAEQMFEKLGWVVRPVQMCPECRKGGRGA